MTNKLLFTLSLLTCMLSQSLVADTLKDGKATEDLSEKFIQMIKNSQTSDAYDLLSRYVIASEKEFETIKSKALSNTDMIGAELGKPLSVYPLKNESIGEHFLRHTYMVKYKKAAIIWQISWYQPEAGWQVMAVNFNANIDPYFIETP